MQKAVCLYECMDDWEKFDEASLPGKENFYSLLNKEDTTYADYVHTKKICQDFEIKNLGEYRYFYIQRDTLIMMNLRTFKICVLKYMSSTMLGFFPQKY